jgi:hypothetical protein
MDGALVCAHHGGRAPLAQNKAAERIDNIQVTVLTRLEALVPLAVEAMEQILGDEKARAADRINAAGMVMDRFVAKKVHAEVEDNRESRDLDAEIETLINNAEETG